MKVILKTTDTIKKWEDIKVFRKILLLSGLKTPLITDFNDKEQAKKFIKRFPNKYILKTNNIECISKNNGIDIVEIIDKTTGNILIRKFVKGVYCELICIYNGCQILTPLIIKIKNLIQPIYENDYKLINEVKKLSPYITNLFIGLFSIKCVVNTDGCYFVEFSTQIGEGVDEILKIDDVIKYINGEINEIILDKSSKNGVKDFNWIIGQKFLPRPKQIDKK